MLANALQHIYEVIVGIDIVQATGRPQALHNADVLRAQLGPAEQPVFFPIGMTLSARSRWFVSIDTSGSSR